MEGKRQSTTVNRCGTMIAAGCHTEKLEFGEQWCTELVCYGAKRPWLSLWESWLPHRGRLRGSRTQFSAPNLQLRYPLSQPVRLTALPKGEPRALPRQCDKLQFSDVTPWQGRIVFSPAGCFAAVDYLFPADPAIKENPGGFPQKRRKRPWMAAGVPAAITDADCGIT